MPCVTYLFGPFQLSAEPPLLLRDGTVVPVTPRALACLVLLVERRSTAVGKQELMDALWPDSFVEEGSLTQLISLLRKALASGFPTGSPIQTLSKVGYRFTAEVEVVAGESAATLPLPAATEQVAPLPLTALAKSSLPGGRPAPDAAEPGRLPQAADGSIPQRRWWWAAGIAAALAIAVVVLLWRSHHARSRPGAGRYAVAVLPFQNLSRAPEAAWVGVAVQEMLATDLRLSRSFRVLPSEDVNRALKEVGWPGEADPGAQTLQRLGPDLDCDHAVVGAYLLQGGRIRLDIRVVDLRTGTTQQESTFEQPEGALLPMLADVSTRTAQGLGVPASGSAEARALATGQDPAASRLFAEGVARNRVYDFRGAIDLLQRAAALAPNFPLIHTQLSMAWSARGQDREAIAEAVRAQQLSGRLPREQQLVVQARVESARRQFAQAAQTYRTLFAFVPDNREYGRLLIQSLSNAGNADDALREANRMLAAPGGQAPDPLLFSVVADMYSNRGDWPNSLLWATRGADESRRRGATILYERLLTTETQAMLHMGQLQPAATRTHEALDLARQFHDVSGELRALNRLGEISTAQGNAPAARAALLAALQLERNQDQTQRAVHTLLSLSRLSQSQGDLRAARNYSEEASALASHLGFADVITEAHLQHAMVQANSGQRDAARAELAQVRAEAGAIHDVFLQQQAESALSKLAP